MNEHFILDWFKSLCRHMRHDEPAFRWFGTRTPGAMLLEVLSDSSNELFCTGYLAAHLRRYGSAIYQDGGARFWVRSEWVKFDISYGAATNEFSRWNDAWWNGETGDLGTIEVKLVYHHYQPSKICQQIAGLASELADRSRRIDAWREQKQPRSGTELAHLDSYRYYGLVLMVGAKHAAPTAMSSVDAELARMGLLGKSEWQDVGELTKEQLAEFWPRTDLTPWTLRMRLVEPARGGGL